MWWALDHTWPRNVSRVSTIHEYYEAMEELSECTEDDLSAADQRNVAEAKERAKEERVEEEEKGVHRTSQAERR
jgi:hypothetical protein